MTLMKALPQVPGTSHNAQNAPSVPLRLHRAMSREQPMDAKSLAQERIKLRGVGGLKTVSIANEDDIMAMLPPALPQPLATSIADPAVEPPISICASASSEATPSTAQVAFPATPTHIICCTTTIQK